MKNNCQNIKKFTVEFMYKSKFIKENTISGGKNIIKDTNDYYKKNGQKENKV